MKYATADANRLVTEFTATAAVQKIVRSFLSDPVGNDLSPQDYAVGERYIEWLVKRGVDPFTEEAFHAFLDCLSSEEAELPPH